MSPEVGVEEVEPLLEGDLDHRTARIGHAEGESGSTHPTAVVEERGLGALLVVVRGREKGELRGEEVEVLLVDFSPYPDSLFSTLLRKNSFWSKGSQVLSSMDQLLE